MNKNIKNIKHDGGTHRVEMFTQGSDVVVRFGHSFTLRVDEKTAWALRDMLHDTARELMIIRRD